jgi:predicted nucleic acid-binding protein
MRQGKAVFVDSGGWVALALLRDPLHAQAREQWDLLHRAGAKLHTSVPVVIETFTFLDRNANRDVALAWRESIYELQTMRILPYELRDLDPMSSRRDATTNDGRAMRKKPGGISKARFEAMIEQATVDAYGESE